MKKDLYLVIGASGTVGAEIVRLLKSQGHDVRTTTSKTAQGTGDVHLNLTNGQGLSEAFHGVTHAFILSPPPHVDQYKLISPLISEAKLQKLKKVVLMTAMGANANEAAPFRRAEIELEKSGLAYNIIRPNWFMQNFNTFWLNGIRTQRKIYLPAGQAKTSFIDARDISAVATALLTSDQFNNRDFDLTGSEAIDHDEAARHISKTTDQNITYQEIKPEDFNAGLRAAGLPSDYSDFLTMIMGFLREGYNAGVNENVKLITGRAPISFAQYAADHKRYWI